MAYEITTNPLRGIEARHGSGHYGMFEHGAHIWSYQPDGQAPVVWLSGSSTFDDDTAVRGGVPVIFPWFGPGRDGGLSPLHGFVRTATWHLADTKDTIDRDGRLIVEYTLDEAMTGEQQHFAAPYEASLIAKFTPEYLQVELNISNSSDADITFDNALHTYLAVGDVRQVAVSGLDGASYLDKVADTEEVQSGDITITAETDRVYRSAGEVVVDDPVLGRKLVITKSGSANTVVWNPWVAKADAMPDFGADEWTGMLCIEAANAFENAITLRPGEVHTLKQRVTIA